MERDRTELRRRFGADDWPPASGERLFVVDLAFGGRELPGFRIVRSALPPSPVTGARSVMSVWQAADAGEAEEVDALVLADVVECDSRDAAGAALIEMLSQFQSPLVDRADGPGEVAFAHGEGAVAFLRGNLAVRVMVGGPAVESVVGAARDLDTGLVSRPDLERTRLAPRFERAPAGRVSGKGRAAVAELDVEARDPQERPLQLKVFTTTGSVDRSNGRLVFRPDGPGRHSIEVYAIAPDGDAAVAEVAVDTS